MCSFTASDSFDTSNPLTDALPEVGSSNPHRMRMVVDLPAPLGPRKPKISPRWTARLTWSTAVNVPKRLTKSRISTALSVSICGSGGAGQCDEDVFERRGDALHRCSAHGGLQLLEGGTAGFDENVQARTRWRRGEHA